jgi:hypothetical protein
MVPSPAERAKRYAESLPGWADDLDSMAQWRENCAERFENPETAPKLLAEARRYRRQARAVRREASRPIGEIQLGSRGRGQATP